jgi:hypothetical protein
VGYPCTIRTPVPFLVPFLVPDHVKHALRRSSSYRHDLIVFNDSLILFAQSLNTVDNLGGCSGSKALDESLVLVSDYAALIFVSQCNIIAKNAKKTYSFLDNRHCVLDDRVGRVLGVADDDLLAVGGSVGQSHEERDEEEMDGELHVC